MRSPLSAQFSGFTDVKVEHNKKIRGLSGQDHPIDAYWEHRVAIYCKNTIAESRRATYKR